MSCSAAQERFVSVSEIFDNGSACSRQHLRNPIVHPGGQYARPDQEHDDAQRQKKLPMRTYAIRVRMATIRRIEVLLAALSYPSRIGGFPNQSIRIPLSV